MTEADPPSAEVLYAGSTRRIVIVCLCERTHEEDIFRANQLARYGRVPRLRFCRSHGPDYTSEASGNVHSTTEASQLEDLDSQILPITKQLTEALETPWIYDGLPADPHLFDYEKDIIEHYQQADCLFPNGIHGVEEPTRSAGVSEEDPAFEKALELYKRRVSIYNKWLKGCPEQWPAVPLCEPAPHENPLKI
jgi:hypothetical protein